MTPDAKRLLTEAEKVVGLRGSFDPADIGKRVGLSPGQAESAARALSNAGVLVLGFDNAAHFTADYRKAHLPAEPKAAKSGSKDKGSKEKGKDKGKDKSKSKSKADAKPAGKKKARA